MDMAWTKVNPKTVTVFNNGMSATIPLDANADQVVELCKNMNLSHKDFGALGARMRQIKTANHKG